MMIGDGVHLQSWDVIGSQQAEGQSHCMIEDVSCLFTMIFYPLSHMDKAIY